MAALVTLCSLSLGVSFPIRPVLQPARSAARRSAPVCTAADQAPALDLVGDGGVIKTMLRPGSESAGIPTRGAVVEVHYVGTLMETGATFDSSRARGKVRSS